MLIDTGATGDPGFPKHFDGKRFYNPDAPQAPGFLAALRWKLTSRPEPASPLSWAGPRRRRKPGVSWENLPPIDAVLISHNHYDHLDLPALRRLAARGDSTFIVPARGARLLRSENIGV